MINEIRKLFGYKFPRLGKTINSIFFKLIKDQIRCELFPGIKVDLDLKDLTQQSTFWMGDRFEYPTSNILRNWGENSEFIFFDIGANYGFYSFLMYSIFSKKVKCFAFEPNPKSFFVLRQTVEANNLTDIVIPANIGLSNKNETLSLYSGIEDSGHSTFLPHPELKNFPIGEVQLKSLDNWISENNIELPDNPKWIAKIDVEGFELNVLKGMEISLKYKSFIGIVVETLDYTLSLNNDKSSDIEVFLNAIGYEKIKNDRLLTKYKRIDTVNSFFVPKDSTLF